LGAGSGIGNELPSQENFSATYETKISAAETKHRSHGDFYFRYVGIFPNLTPELCRWATPVIDQNVQCPDQHHA